MIGDAVGIAKSIRAATNPVLGRHPAQQRHADLRTESGSQAQGVLDGIDAAFRQVQRPSSGSTSLKLATGGTQSGFQRLHRDDIFDAGAHGVTGEALGVGDHDLIGGVAEDAAQRVDLRGGAAAARGCVGFVGDEDRLRRDLAPRNAAVRFRLGAPGSP